MLPCRGCSAFANLLLFCAILLFHIQRDRRREQQLVTTDISCCYSLTVTHLHTEGCCLLITIHSWYVDMYASARYMWTGRQGMEAAAVAGRWPHIGNHCLDTWLQPPMFENGKKMLILHGTRTSAVLKFVLADVFHLMRDHYVKYANNKDNNKTFESRGPTSLEVWFFCYKVRWIELIVATSIRGYQRVPTRPLARLHPICGSPMPTLRASCSCQQ